MAHVQLVTPPTYWRCEPGWSWTSKPLGDHLLWCVLGGVGRMVHGSLDVPLEPGVCFVFRPGDAPIATHDPRRRLLVFGMHFVSDNTDGVWCKVTDQSLLHGLARRADRLYRRGDVPAAAACLEFILALIHDDATHPPPSGVDGVLAELAEAIRQDPRRRWSVAELAERAALSRAQFTRRFTALTGAPPAKFLIQARISRARQLLAETGMSVTQVSAALGYTDVAHFSRQYKQYTGSPPTLG
ncbi:helix-turn-helix domain-containing protein [Allorhizocola rhizosphaerae]|uniref:helix-turn-helix domain-containing protein n=1 Tax=Allorhizocola rhizosphaerae TaxID=1872709 RepID=UPI001B8CEDDF|nr:AraC family transcriptional regulator [Allorhizocola rhizosphaerae]